MKMKKVLGMLLLIVLIFISTINVNAQAITDVTKAKRAVLINVLSESGNADVNFSAGFNNLEESLVVSAYLKNPGLDVLPPETAKMFWQIMYEQWTYTTRLAMVTSLQIRFFELVLYNTKHKEIGRYKGNILVN